MRFGAGLSAAGADWVSFGRLGSGRLAPGRWTLGSRCAPAVVGGADVDVDCDRGGSVAVFFSGSLKSGRGRTLDPRTLGYGLPAAGLVLAPGLLLALVVVRPDDDAADDSGADAGGVAAGGVDAGGLDVDEDESGARGRTGPFPLPLGGVPLEFNAVSPLWRHHRLPAPYTRCWQ